MKLNLSRYRAELQDRGLQLAVIFDPRKHPHGPDGRFLRTNPTSFVPVQTQLFKPGPLPPAIQWMDDNGISRDFGDLNRTIMPEQAAQATMEAAKRFPNLLTDGFAGFIPMSKMSPEDYQAFVDAEEGKGQNVDGILMATPGVGPPFHVFVNDMNGENAETDLAPALTGDLAAATVDPYGRVLHELGHVLLFQNEINPQQVMASMDYVGMTREEFASKVSYYGASHPLELEAEAFVTHFRPEYLDQLDPDMHDKLVDFAGAIDTAAVINRNSDVVAGWTDEQLANQPDLAMSRIPSTAGILEWLNSLDTPEAAARLKRLEDFIDASG